jgi:hypothetical protein
MAKQTFSVGQVLTAAQMTSLQQTAMLGGAASAKTASYTLVAADAGTAISMTSTSATTITVNTGLFAAGDTVQITNLGSGVCTITAGTATVNTSASLALAQYESGTLDFTSASAAIFIKGAGAAAASSGMTLIGTTSFSSSSAVNVNDVFSTTYANYIVRTDFVASGTVGMTMRLRVSGSDNTTSDYNRQSFTAYGATVEANRGSNESNFQVPAASTAGSYIQFSFFNPFETAKTGVIMDTVSYAGSGIEATRTSMAFAAATSFTGFSLIPASGNITGTVRVYGLANS